ncbi:MAG: hypothetical protein FJ100_02135 [Deltaproteobacteria bacterium]|nr:hypothetical protein [Deltaproteobacteria bacterium]
MFVLSPKHSAVVAGLALPACQVFLFNPEPRPPDPAPFVPDAAGGETAAETSAVLQDVTKETAIVPGVDVKGNDRKPEVTSPPDVWRNPNQFPPLFTALAIGNATYSDRVVRVRPLKPTVSLDCAKVAAGPSVWLSRSLFAPAKTWVVPAGRAFAPADGKTAGACTALLIDGGGLPMRLVFYTANQYPPKQMPSTVTGGDPERLLVLDVWQEGIDFGKHPAVYTAPPAVNPGAPPGCPAPYEPDALAWSEPMPQGDVTVLDVLSAPNGCHAIEWLTKTGSAKSMLCVPPGSFPFEVGDDVFIAPLQGGHNLGKISGFEFIHTTKRLRFGRGADIVYYGKGKADIAAQAGCGAGYDACGSVIANLQVNVAPTGGTAQGLSAGKTAKLPDGSKLWINVAFDAPVADKACTGNLTDGRRVESVFSQGVP